eukprot:TRINITY_DN10287_c0_g1_i1.p1 TRINITY_DN10287_c0_g1~~TRINITY_DN10287_c0_g1_i1.p1  ORF type:complete len:583 (+),score=109.93 TRINITY_DN10287_c0_g1_i1:91-1839(+)
MRQPGTLSPQAAHRPGLAFTPSPSRQVSDGGGTLVTCLSGRSVTPLRLRPAANRTPHAAAVWPVLQSPAATSRLAYSPPPAPPPRDRSAGVQPQWQHSSPAAPVSPLHFPRSPASHAQEACGRGLPFRTAPHRSPPAPRSPAGPLPRRPPADPPRQRQPPPRPASNAVVAAPPSPGGSPPRSPGSPASPAPRQGRDALAAAEERLRKVFSKIDRSGKGSLRRADVIRALRGHRDIDQEIAALLDLPLGRVREGRSRDVFESVFQAMDSDGDRNITWPEFRAYLLPQMLRRMARHAARAAQSEQRKEDDSAGSDCSVGASPQERRERSLRRREESLRRREEAFQRKCSQAGLGAAAPAAAAPSDPPAGAPAFTAKRTSASSSGAGPAAGVPLQLCDSPRPGGGQLVRAERELRAFPEVRNLPALRDELQALEARLSRAQGRPGAGADTTVVLSPPAPLTTGGRHPAAAAAGRSGSADEGSEPPPEAVLAARTEVAEAEAVALRESEAAGASLLGAVRDCWAAAESIVQMTNTAGRDSLITACAAAPADGRGSARSSARGAAPRFSPARCCAPPSGEDGALEFC